MFNKKVIQYEKKSKPFFKKVLKDQASFKKVWILFGFG